MNAPAFTGHALCQALVLEGVPNRTEANIESLLRRLWESNGPDFVLDYVKVLKEDTEKTLVDPNYRYAWKSGKPSVAWDHRNSRPKGPLGCIYKLFPMATARIRVIGSILQSVTYEYATKRQLDKFVSTVRSNTRSSRIIRFSDTFLQNLERRLAKHIREVSEPFGPSDLTNNVLPYAHVAEATEVLKQRVALGLDRELRSSEAVHSAVGELWAHTVGQMYTAPRVCKKTWNQALDLVYVDDKSGDTYHRVRFPSGIQPRPFEARDYETSRIYGILADDCAEFSARGKSDYLGRLDFLQKPGGKLRSIANVNRFVNFTMEPFAEALEDVFYTYPECAVKDQKAGLRWAQSQLAKGVKLTSLDLTAATDTLDYRVFTRAIARDFPGSTGLLKLYSKYFEDLSSLPLWCDGLDCAIQFKTGQPLGMKGSFQVLTAMNLVAGSIAVRRSEMADERDAQGNRLCLFQVVGDDFVCDSRIAKQYNEVITSWGGSTNVEKAMESSIYAEFLSHLVSKDRVYVTKPKYRLGNKALFSNLEKAKVRSLRGIYRLSQDEKNAVEILSTYSVDEMDFRNCLPHLRSKQLSLCNTQLDVMAKALDIVSEWRCVEPDGFTISSTALQFLLEEGDARGSLSDYIEHYAPSAKRQAVKPKIVQDSVLTVPTSISVYDHHTGSTRKKVSRSSEKATMMSRARDIQKLHASYTGTGKPGTIDLGSNRKVHSDSIVLAAMHRQEIAGAPPSRKEATMRESSLSKHDAPDAVEINLLFENISRSCDRVDSHSESVDSDAELSL